jgi:hypothetical protein
MSFFSFVLSKAAENPVLTSTSPTGLSTEELKLSFKNSAYILYMQSYICQHVTALKTQNIFL